MPLKRTYSTSTTVVPTAGYQQGKKRRILSRRATPKVQMLSAPGTPFPTRCKAQLRYTSYANLNPVIGSVNLQYVRCNGIYDPDASGVGGQPRGFDQYAQLYDQYTVNNARLKIWVASSNSATYGTDKVLAGISIVDGVTTTPAIDNCADRPYTTFKLINSTAAASDQMITSNWNRAKRFPKDQTYQSLSAQIAANPAEEEFFQIWLYSAYFPLASSCSVTVQYEVVYDVEFYELKQIPAS